MKNEFFYLEKCNKIAKYSFFCQELYKNFKKYKKIWKDNGITVDVNTLSNSYRCSPTTFDFVRDNLGIPVYSHGQEATRIIYVDTQNDADALFNDSSKVKLFYSEAYKYRC